MLVLAIICVFSLLTIWTPISNAEVQKPEWKVGDKWYYETPDPGINANLTVKVIDITTINVNETDYDVYVVNSTFLMSMSGDNSTEYWDKYISTDNFATVKENIFRIGFAREIIRRVVTYKPPRMDYDFPLSVGKAWKSIYTEYVDVEGQGVFSFSTIHNYTVLGEEKITTLAGTFECYKIERDHGSGIKNYLWYSKDVKNIVNTTGGTEEMPWNMELVSYNISSEDGDGDNDGGKNDKKDGEFDLFAMPYLLILILVPIIIVIIIILWIVIRRRK